MARTPKAGTTKRGRGGKALSAATAIAEAKAEQEKRIDTTVKLPSTNTVKNLVKDVNGAALQAREISGTIGPMIKKAVDEKNLDKAAFAIARKLDAMSDSKLHDVYHHLIKYMDDLGIVKRATAQSRLPVDTEQSDADESEGAPAGGGGFTVVEGGRQVSEAAGAG